MTYPLFVAAVEPHKRTYRTTELAVRGVDRGGCTFVVRQAGLP